MSTVLLTILGVFGAFILLLIFIACIFFVIAVIHGIKHQFFLDAAEREMIAEGIPMNCDVCGNRLTRDVETYLRERDNTSSD